MKLAGWMLIAWLGLGPAWGEPAPDDHCGLGKKLVVSSQYRVHNSPAQRELPRPAPNGDFKQVTDWFDWDLSIDEGTVSMTSTALFMPTMAGFPLPPITLRFAIAHCEGSPRGGEVELFAKAPASVSTMNDPVARDYAKTAADHPESIRIKLVFSGCGLDIVSPTFRGDVYEHRFPLSDTRTAGGTYFEVRNTVAPRFCGGSLESENPVATPARPAAEPVVPGGAELVCFSHQCCAEDAMWGHQKIKGCDGDHLVAPRAGSLIFFTSREYVNAAKDAFAVGAYKLAKERFLAAYALDADPLLLRAVALCLGRLGDAAGAASYRKKYEAASKH